MVNDNKRPSFSIIITVSNDAQLLNDNLPALLSLQYEGNYQVIVVDKSSDDNTTDVLDRLKSEHPKLYSTFLPRYQFQNTPQRLALTLGVKASKYDWVIFTDLSNVPSPQWLQDISETADTSSELILGYFQKKSGDLLLQQFGDISEASTIISLTERDHVNGHQGKLLRRLRGKYDFMMVRSAKAHEVLRLFDCEVKGLTLLNKRIKGFLFNLFH